MRHLQRRILISYLGTLLLSLTAFLAISSTVGFEKTRDNFGHLYQMQIDGAIRAYEEGGPAALDQFLHQMDQWFTSTHYLVDAGNVDLVTGEIRPPLPDAAPRWGFPGRVYRRLFRVPISFAVPSPDGKYRLIFADAQYWDNVQQQLPYYLLVLVATSVLYWFVPMGIASALKNIAATADRFGRGDLDARVQPPNRKDEIGDVGQAFNAMAARIQTLLVAERRLLQDVSHELRSPLARLAFATELARTAPDRQAAIDRLKRELECLSGLVASLLDLTRTEGDPLSHKIEPLRFEDVIKDVVESCTLEAEARHCRIDVVGSSGATIHGDRELLRRAFDNVVRNGVQYSPPGSTIEVHLRETGEDTEIGVRDYGPGVPNDLLARIFEPFFRVDDARRTSTGGVGLGLSIVQRIIQLHNGSLTAENTNPGLRVTITMPKAA